jgi:hypothetical protein
VLTTVAPIVKLIGFKVAVFVLLATRTCDDVTVELTVEFPTNNAEVLATTLAPTSAATEAVTLADMSASPTTVKPFSALNVEFAICYLI